MILKNELISNEFYVWPSGSGNEKGLAIQPLYPNAILAVQQDARLYDALALVDSIRIGRVRDKTLAIEKLKTIIKAE